MNSTEEQAPLNISVEATHTEGKPHRAHPQRHKRRSRNRRGRPRGRHNTTPTEHTQTEGSQLNQARQNHSTFDRALHHRSQGGTGYGMKRDHVATESELSGANIPEVLLPSYAHCLARMGITVSEPVPHHQPYHPPSEAVEPTLTDAQQQAWEEQQMRQAHEQDQQQAVTPDPAPDA
jgi:hypothetical protein